MGGQASRPALRALVRMVQARSSKGPPLSPGLRRQLGCSGSNSCGNWQQQWQQQPAAASATASISNSSVGSSSQRQQPAAAASGSGQRQQPAAAAHLRRMPDPAAAWAAAGKLAAARPLHWGQPPHQPPPPCRPLPAAPLRRQGSGSLHSTSCTGSHSARRHAQLLPTGQQASSKH